MLLSPLVFVVWEDRADALLKAGKGHLIHRARGHPPQNPFSKLARFGVQAEVPPVAQPPDGAVVRNLLTLWARMQQTR